MAQDEPASAYGKHAVLLIISSAVNANLLYNMARSIRDGSHAYIVN